jgi:hypothetical protein
VWKTLCVLAAVARGITKIRTVARGSPILKKMKGIRRGLRFPQGMSRMWLGMRSGRRLSEEAARFEGSRAGLGNVVAEEVAV